MTTSRLILPAVLAVAFGLTALPAAGVAGSAATSSKAAPATCDSATPTLEGTRRPDVLVGTRGNDVIFGHHGDDIIRGLQGDDLLCGGRGADTLYGMAGDDRLFGAIDRIRQSGDSDHVYWGDRLVGGVGSDYLDAGKTSEPEYAQPEVFDFSDLPARVAVDLTSGIARSGDDRDVLAHYHGVLHDRRIIATRYDDRLIGTRDDDQLWGGGGDDFIRAGDGGDSLRGGAGRDRLFGQGDHDGSRDPYEPSSGGDEIYPGRGGDLVVPGADGSAAFFGDTVRFDDSSRGVDVDLRAGTATGQGNDTLRIEGPITLFGSAHDDILRAGRYAEILIGLAGDDRLYGRQKGDELYGDGEPIRANRGRGVDRLFGGQDRDVLYGGPLADRLDGGQGRDAEFDAPNINTCRRIEQIQRGGC